MLVRRLASQKFARECFKGNEINQIVRTEQQKGSSETNA